MSEVETGKKCPQCGAEGRHDGMHETAVRNHKLPDQTIADFGWRCWNCGHEWGFEVPEEGVKILGEEGGKQ